MILSKAKIYGAIGSVVVFGALVAALTIQQSRLSFAQLERDTATQMYERSTAQLQAANAHRERTEAALADRQRRLNEAQRQAQALRSEMQRLSSEVADEQWQACRSVRIPDALIERLRTEN